VSYDEYYFANCCGLPYRRDAHWLGFFGRIADRIAGDIRPATVLDAATRGAGRLRALFRR
jgi:hypothetical protein